eukprot:TRINITY_DN1232_c0_g3_i1.p1 TRINITY_DN1232_c0_g3~~TRINITY_DN1232_c0_g3_i1.p1  ORF type:complete len:205 (-),score=3.79 TRINITY_DN1232_c0_g3_i1:591-1205(-)
MLRLLIVLGLVASSFQSCSYAGTCCCQPLPSKANLLSQSDWKVFWLGLSGYLGECKVIDATQDPNAACDFYVQSAIHGTGSYKGYPLTTAGTGTGCVKAPDYPKHVTTCWYDDADYGLAINQITHVLCTEYGVPNAAAQLRHAIQNDACNCNLPYAQAIPLAAYDDSDYYTEAQFLAGNTGQTGQSSTPARPSGNLFGSFGNFP